MRTYGVCVKKTQVYCTTAPPEVTTLLAWGYELVDDTCESEIVAYHRLFTVAAVGFIAGGALTIQLWWLTTATECQCNWFTRNVSRGEYHHCLGKMLRTVHVF